MGSGQKGQAGCWGNKLPSPRPLWWSRCVPQVAGSPGRDPFHYDWDINYPWKGPCGRLGPYLVAQGLRGGSRIN